MSAFEPYNHEPHAIEVAAMLGDSVVSVKHCIDPRSGKITPRTWAIAAGAGVAALLSAIAFIVSVTAAAANQTAYTYWTHVLHKPVGAFRPEQVSPVWDWLAFGGLALAVGAAALAIARIRDERRSPYYRIGTAPDVEQPLDAAPTPSFPLVAPIGDDFIFHFAPGIDGNVTVAGKTVTFADLTRAGQARPSAMVAGAFALPIPPAAKIRARAGRTTFLVSSIVRPQRQTMPLVALESRTVKYFAGSLAAHLAILLVFSMMPTDIGAANIDLAAYEKTTTSSAMGDHEDTPPPPPPQTVGGGESNGGVTGMAIAGPEGKAGKENGTLDPVRMQVKHRSDAEQQLARQQAIDEARYAGVLGSASVMTGMIANISSDSNLANGFDENDAYGPVDGRDGPGSAYGFGLGRRDFGPGGGGTNLIGGGGYGTICGGPGHRCGYGTGTRGILEGGGPGGHGHHSLVPGVAAGEPRSTGDLDKSIIRRYIKRNIEKIAYCYEHELLAHPDLAGTVQVQFFIQPDGAVSSSEASGLDATVASCVAGVVRAISFPKPSGGGGVSVNYPFTFHAAGH